MSPTGTRACVSTHCCCTAWARSALRACAAQNFLDLVSNTNRWPAPSSRSPWCRSAQTTSERKPEELLVEVVESLRRMDRRLETDLARAYERALRLDQRRWRFEALAKDSQRCWIGNRSGGACRVGGKSWKRRRHFQGLATRKLSSQFRGSRKLLIEALCHKISHCRNLPKGSTGSDGRLRAVGRGADESLTVSDYRREQGHRRGIRPRG
jgi:uncharacterized protein YecT (DUF1311 family)